MFSFTASNSSVVTVSAHGLLTAARVGVSDVLVEIKVGFCKLFHHSIPGCPRRLRLYISTCCCDSQAAHGCAHQHPLNTSDQRHRIRVCCNYSSLGLTEFSVHVVLLTGEGSFSFGSLPINFVWKSNCADSIQLISHYDETKARLCLFFVLIHAGPQRKH